MFVAADRDCKSLKRKNGRNGRVTASVSVLCHTLLFRSHYYVYDLARFVDDLFGGVDAEEGEGGGKSFGFGSVGSKHNLAFELAELLDGGYNAYWETLIQKEA